MFKYHCPPSSCKTCCAMVKLPVPSTKDKVPENVPDRMPGPTCVYVGVRSYSTPVLAPGRAGPWMWERVESADNPDHGMLLNVKAFKLVSKVSVPEPDPCRPPPPSCAPS